MVTDTERSILKVSSKGDVEADAVVVRNTVLDAAAGDATAALSTAYLYVGVDAAIGYPFARQDSGGKEVSVPLDLHSQPTDTAKLSAGISGTKKTTPATSATHSQATKTTKVNTKAAAEHAVDKPAIASKKPDGAGTLTVKTTKVSSETATKLTPAGLDIIGGKATVDIDGRIHKLDTTNGCNVTAINDTQPELAHLEATKAQVTTVGKAKPTEDIGGRTHKLDTTNGCNVTAINDTQPEPTHLEATNAQVTVDKASLSAGTSGTKKPRSSAAKKTTSTTASTAAKSTATAAKPTTGQAIVKQANGKHHFLFQVKEGGLFPEIGDWTVGAGSEYHVISHHGLVVHSLDLKNDLGLRVLAEDHTFSPLDGIKDLTGFVSGKGQDMMVVLAGKGHAIESSEIEDGAATAKEYHHYDSHTPFPLWVMDSTAVGKKLVLSGVDLAAAGVLAEGVYAMPLAKDFSAKLPDSDGNTSIALAVAGVDDANLEVKGWKILGNDYFDKVLLIQVAKKTGSGLSAGTLDRVLMSSKAQGGRSVASSQLDAVVAKLDPTNLVSTSFANVATAEKLGAVEQYAVTFNHDGVQFGLTYNLDGGNAFSSKSGTTSFGTNVATDVLGLKAIVSAEASVDAGKNALVDASVASYNAGLTFAKAYNLAGLSVVPMAGFGVSSNALNGYTAFVPMAAGALGLSMNDVSFSAATFHAGVSVALDDFAAKASGVNASLTFGVAGYLAANATAKVSTNEGQSADLTFDGATATPYAQFNLGLASGETLNAMISKGSVAVNFGFNR